MSIRIRRIIHPLFTLLGKRILTNPQVIENRIHLKSQAMVKLDTALYYATEQSRPAEGLPPRTLCGFCKWEEIC